MKEVKNARGALLCHYFCAAEKKDSLGSSCQVDLCETACGAYPRDQPNKTKLKRRRFEKKINGLLLSCSCHSVGSTCTLREGKDSRWLWLYVFRIRFAGCGPAEVVVQSSGSVRRLLMFTPRHG